MTEEELIARGKRDRQPTSQAVVNYWVVPGGCEYDQAYCSKLFFDNLDDAKALAQIWWMPNELATFLTIQQYDEVLEIVRNQTETLEGEIA